MSIEDSLFAATVNGGSELSSRILPKSKGKQATASPVVPSGADLLAAIIEQNPAAYGFEKEGDRGR